MYKTGVSGIDDIVRGFPPGTLLVIAGEPGTGKTTLATKIVYTNMVERGSKALYISVAETPEKFFMYMKMLGIDLQRIPRGKFEFMYFEAIKGQETVIMISEVIKDYLMNRGYDIVVVDSITSLLEWLSDAEARNFLHASLYEISSHSKGLLILIEDLSRHEKAPSILEYIADAFIELRTRTINGLLTRSLVFRKIRGRRIVLGEIPFSITEHELISAYSPPMLEQIPAIISGKKMRLPCRNIDRTLGGIYKGSQVMLLYPLTTNTPDAYYGLPLLLAAEYGLKMGIISYDIPASAMICRMKKLLKSLGYNENIIDKIINIHYSLNPLLFPMSELYNKFIRILIKNKIDLLIIRGIRLLIDLKRHENIMWYLYNISLQLRYMGVTSFYYIHYNYPYKIDSIVHYGDIVITYEPKITDNEIKDLFIIWKSFNRRIAIVSDAEIVECMNNIREKNSSKK